MTFIWGNMQAGDVYALGLLIIEMASGESPWGVETSFQEAMDLAVHQKKRPPVPAFLSRSVRVSCCPFTDLSSHVNTRLTGECNVLQASSSSHGGVVIPQDQPSLKQLAKQLSLAS